MEKLTKYFQDTLLELKQVSWPSRKQALLYSALVVGISVLVALFVAGFDFVFGQGINFIIRNF
jgi:preprotein translocase SecE subunit